MGDRIIWFAAALFLGLSAPALAEEGDSTAAGTLARDRPRVAAPT